MEELRAAGLAAVADMQGEGGVRMENVLGDVSTHIGNSPLAVGQAASQFNCLEFPSPNHTPNDGITGYAFDRWLLTQTTPHRSVLRLCGHFRGRVMVRVTVSILTRSVR